MLNTEMFDPDHCVVTHSGGLFYLADEDEKHESTITLDDIAHSLSNICRFVGHTRQFYSDAEHAVLVSLLVGRQFALAGLHHDDHEAVLGDCSSPLRRQPFMRSYNVLAASVQRRLNPIVGLPQVWSDETIAEVKLADARMLKTEFHCMMSKVPEHVSTSIYGHYARFIPLWAPSSAKDMYLKIHACLVNNDEREGNLYDHLRRHIVAVA